MGIVFQNYKTYSIVLRYTGCDKDVMIPPENMGLPVTGICEDAFAGNTLLHSVTFPPSIHTVGARAFKGCCHLNQIRGQKATDSAMSIFSKHLNCLGAQAFYGTQLVNLEFLSENMEIGEMCFCECRSLADVNLGKCTSLILKQGAFKNSGITSIFAPSAAPGLIPECCFQNCYRLKRVEIPFCIADDYSFSGCIELRRASFPEKMLYLSEKAFDKSDGHESQRGTDRPAALLPLRSNRQETADLREEDAPRRWNRGFCDIPGIIHAIYIQNGTVNGCRIEASVKPGNGRFRMIGDLPYSQRCNAEAAYLCVKTTVLPILRRCDTTLFFLDPVKEEKGNVIGLACYMAICSRIVNTPIPFSEIAVVGGCSINGAAYLDGSNRFLDIKIPGAFSMLVGPLGMKELFAVSTNRGEKAVFVESSEAQTLLGVILSKTQGSSDSIGKNGQ